MSRLLILLLVTLYPTFSIAQDFRGVNWGMTREEVNDIEPGNPKVLSKRVLYQRSLGQLNVDLVYLFDNNALYRGKYIVTEKLAEETDYIYLYQQLQDLLSEKYGEPKNKEVNWRSDEFKGKPDEYGEAIKQGQLSYVTYWRTPETRIQLSLSNASEEVALTILYTSRNDLKLIDDSNKDQILKDL